MSLADRIERIDFRWMVAVGCLYEIAALPSWSPLPTISRMINVLNDHPLLRIIAWIWSGGWAWHFLAHPGKTLLDEVDR